MRVPVFPLRPSTSVTSVPDTGSGRRPAWDAEERAEFDELIRSGALHLAEGSDQGLRVAVGQCNGTLFFVRQTPRGGIRKLRLIYDCRRLNAASATPDTFALDDLFMIPTYLSNHPSRYLAKIDLRSAYYQVPVDPRDQRLLACLGPDGRRYLWKVLPMGWSHAPKLFQELSTCFRDAWRAAGYIVCTYLDDYLIGALEAERYVETLETIVSDLIAADVQLKVSKCEIDMATSRTYLGAIVNPNSETLALPAGKVEELTGWAAAQAGAATVDLEELATWVGRASFARLVAPRLGYYLVHCYRALPLLLRPSEWRSDGPTASPDIPGGPHHRKHFAPKGIRIPVSEAIRDELQWWAAAGERLSRPRAWRYLCTARVWARREAPRPEHTMGIGRSDASATGVGGTWVPLQATMKERTIVVTDLLPQWVKHASSTARELYAAARTIAALPTDAGRVIRFIMDSQAAVATAVTGGACRGTIRAAQYLDEVLENRKMEVFFEWESRDQLQQEDAASRAAAADPSEATVTTKDFDTIVQREWRDRPTVDAFASEATSRAARFGARWKSPRAIGDGCEILKGLGPGERAWAYPPFSLAKATIAAAASSASIRAGTSSCILILPSRPDVISIVRSLGWKYSTGPTVIRLPNLALRAPSEPLIVVRT